MPSSGCLSQFGTRMIHFMDVIPLIDILFYFVYLIKVDCAPESSKVVNRAFFGTLCRSRGVFQQRDNAVILLDELLFFFFLLTPLFYFLLQPLAFA